ncbi:MAG: rod shape-determining protein MreC [Treponemataceae bacterium]|nr:rod shape-determining protein MreC [Treponemataceae bacterium]
MEKRKAQQSKRLSLVFLSAYLIVAGVLLSLSSGGFVVNFREVGFSIVSSGQKLVNSVVTSTVRFFTSISELTNLQREYALLSEKLEHYEYLQRNNTEIRKENERLKELLGFVETVTYKNYTASIIGRDPNALYSGITLNKGSRHGIKKGMPVISIQNGNVGLVGKVVSVGRGTCQVLPVYDYQCNVSSRIEKTRDIGIVSGNGNDDGTLVMKYVKKRVLPELAYGDIVVTSGENDNYMRDIPVGTITGITVLDYDTSLEIELTPIIDFSRLETVLIVDADRGVEDAE